MRVEEFSNNLYLELEKELSEIIFDDNNILEGAKSIFNKIQGFISRLKEFIIKYKFENKIEEINFFRNIKPKFFSKLIYYKKLYVIQSKRPLAIVQDQKPYYINELNKINNYYEENIEFINYYKTGSNLFDVIYFTRSDPDPWLLLNSDDLLYDRFFSTFYDNKIARWLAYQNVVVYIINSIEKLDAIDIEPQGNKIFNNSKIQWTGTKASLIELLYAIQSSGSLNNGTIDVKSLAALFESTFNVKLGNFYRTFQEIRIRKISRTTFLDKLKELLVRRMDESDENPKY